MPIPMSRRAFAGLMLAAGLSAPAVIPAAHAEEYSKDNPLKVVLVLHGNLGDKSFFDSAAAGLEKAKAELPVDVKVIEAGYDRGRWQPLSLCWHSLLECWHRPTG